jgi:hypothetical protein
LKLTISLRLNSNFCMLSNKFRGLYNSLIHILSIVPLHCSCTIILMTELSVLLPPVRLLLFYYWREESKAFVEDSHFLRYWVPAENENNQDEADDDEVKFMSTSGYLL